ncbi:MAG: ABC transporter permease subunit, partial [Clostridium sp.]|nr:ABC transporter permease subunit [Clostridium sp.]
MNYLLGLMPQVLEGLKVTLEIFILTLVLSIPLGIIVGLMRTSKSIILRKISGAYVLIMRGTPLLLQIIVIFFGLPLLGITFDRFPSAIIAFTLNPNKA